MAEFYVYIGPIWMEAPGVMAAQQQKINDKPVAVADKTKMLGLLQKKYDVRYTPGDIVQVVKGKTLYDEQDKKWKGDCHNPKLAIIRVDGLKLEDALAYEVPHENVISVDNTELLHRRRHQINLSALTLTQQQELADHRRTSITLADFNSHKVDKNI